MSDPIRYRLSLVLALVGALTVFAQAWSNLAVGRFSGADLPTFRHSAPAVREWPVPHQYLPIG